MKRLPIEIVFSVVFRVKMAMKRNIFHENGHRIQKDCLQRTRPTSGNPPTMCYMCERVDSVQTRFPRHSLCEIAQDFFGSMRSLCT